MEHGSIFTGQPLNTFIKYERDSEDGPTFTSGQPSQWIPSSLSVPIHVTTSDGAVTWKGEWCWVVDNMTMTSFIIATDGSANDESMLYGWKISTVREE
eukprot:4839817-Ditylum_brightwellii.AAC.1